MESEKYQIKLDSPENTYFSGQAINGLLLIKLTKKTKLRGIKYQFTGKGKTKWIEILHNESLISNSGNPRSIIYSGCRSYQADEGYIFGSKSGRPVELVPGEHTYNFSIQLKEWLPSSVTGNYGSVKYKLKITVHNSWSFDDSLEIPVTVVTQSVAPPGTRPVVKQVTRNIGVFGSGPISLVAELPNEYVVRNKAMQLNVSVDNQSSTHIDKLKFSIRQTIGFWSLKPLETKKAVINKIYRKDTGGIQKKSQRSFSYELELPSCQPTDYISIITISYVAQIDIVLPGLYKNITIFLPFNVVTAAFDSGRITQYPEPNNVPLALNASVDSPSHSFYSENGSIYSNMSDSSLSTLSPMSTSVDFVRNYFGTATNASSGRSSVRSSIGFQLSQGSPQHYPTQEPFHYPPSMPSHNERPHYVQPSISPYPNDPHPIRNTNSDPAELPPSYDELFGATSQSASAPPMTPPSKNIN